MFTDSWLDSRCVHWCLAGQPSCSLVPGWPAVVFTGAWLASRCLVHWVPGWPAVVLFNGAWLASRCVHWLPGWPAVVFTGCLASQPLCSLDAWLASRCVHWLPGWLADCCPSLSRPRLSGSERVAAC